MNNARAFLFYPLVALLLPLGLVAHAEEAEAARESRLTLESLFQPAPLPEEEPEPEPAPEADPAPEPDPDAAAMEPLVPDPEPPPLIEEDFAPPPEPARAPRSADWMRYDPAGPPFVLPDPVLFRARGAAGPAAAAAPSEAEEAAEEVAAADETPPHLVNLPRLPQRGFSDRPVELPPRRALFREEGRRFAPRTGNAVLTIENPTHDLRFRYVLQPGASEGRLDAESNDKELVFYLGPQIVETFELPPGDVAVVREVWRDDLHAHHKVVERFQANNLREDFRYSAKPGDTEVRRLHRELDMMGRR